MVKLFLERLHNNKIASGNRIFKEYEVKASIESDEQNMENIQNSNNEDILNYIFSDDFVDDYIIDNNEGIFKEILTLFSTNFDQICPEEKKEFYLQQAEKICEDRKDFGGLKEIFKMLNPEFMQIKSTIQ